MPTKRPLIEKETRLLKQMNLSPGVESVIKKVWLEKKPPSKINLGSFVSCILSPVLILVLAGSLLNLHPLFAAIKPFAVIAACLAWAVLVYNQFTADRVRRFAKDVRITPGGVDVSLFHPDQNEAKRSNERKIPQLNVKIVDLSRFT